MMDSLIRGAHPLWLLPLWLLASLLYTRELT